MTNTVKTSQAQHGAYRQNKHPQEDQACNYADNYYGDKVCSAVKVD